VNVVECGFKRRPVRPPRVGYRCPDNEEYEQMMWCAKTRTHSLHTDYPAQSPASPRQPADHHALDDSVSNQEVPTSSTRVGIQSSVPNRRATEISDKKNSPPPAFRSPHVTTYRRRLESRLRAPGSLRPRYATPKTWRRLCRAGDVQCHDVIGKRRLQVPRRLNPL